MMDSFLVNTGYKAIMKINIMVYSIELAHIIFEEVSQVIKKNLRPKKKLVIAERTKFLSKMQEQNETV